MTLENESPETKETVTGKVTDEALESALEHPEVQVEPEVEVRVEPEVRKELPSDQEERTRLGRHLKRLEERLDRDKLERENLSQKFDEVISRFDRPSRTENTSEEDNELVSTVADVRRVARADRRQEEEERTRDQGQYEQKYVGALRNLERENPTLHQEIFKEMMTNFNVRRSNDPSLDADLNYTKAKSAVLAKKISASSPKPNVAGGKTTASTDLSIESRDISPVGKELKLDPLAESFVRSTGMSEKSQREAIGKK